ncbi:hypothetical protein E2493_15610 [Sphingomonas parva]|uniref:Uncharacterized protein n=1 Tax=Sphingomonas parva TaxID=2555898 RepID=A0A4Y8ZMW2_9SPHN|nr:hypothetical protein [Sphingomonas parva]TFI57294.1 hypothetical protein E2493_15610 [Sphingomonas parva]
MRLLILTALAAAVPGSAAPPSTPEGARAPSSRQIPIVRGTLCDRADVHWADNVGSPEARPLTELPPGDTILAVYREREDGCIDPVIVRYGDPGRAPRAPAPEPVRPRARTWR